MLAIYLWLLTNTIGADSFQVREQWTTLFKQIPIARVLIFPGIAHTDPEIVNRVTKITGICRPSCLETWLDLHALITLHGKPETACRDGKWWGDIKFKDRADRLEHVAKSFGMVDYYETLMYGEPPAARYLYYLRHKNRKLPLPEGHAAYPYNLTATIPKLMPEEKR